MRSVVFHEFISPSPDSGIKISVFEPGIGQRAVCIVLVGNEFIVSFCGFVLLLISSRKLFIVVVVGLLDIDHQFIVQLLFVEFPHHPFPHHKVVFIVQLLFVKFPHHPIEPGIVFWLFVLVDVFTVGKE
jgi:hypothetical protein